MVYHISALVSHVHCNIAIMRFLVSHECEIRFHDVIDRTVHMFTSSRHPTQKKKKIQNIAK